jgi:peroxiredoxin
VALPSLALPVEIMASRGEEMMSALRIPAPQLLLVCALLPLLGARASAASPHPTQAVISAPGHRKPASSFTLHDARGGTVLLADFRGKVLVLNFFATACDGCRIEIPWFMEFTRAYGSSGVAVVGISTDIIYERLSGANEAWSRINPFVRAQNVTYPILMGDERVVKLYGVDSIPSTYLIDARGRVAARYAGVIDKNNLDSNIRSLRTELAKSIGGGVSGSRIGVSRPGCPAGIAGSVIGKAGAVKKG